MVVLPWSGLLHGDAGDRDFKGRMGKKKHKVDAVTGDPAFEQWVGRQLHKMYDEVLAEDVPGELLRVVDRLAERGATAPGPRAPAEETVEDDAVTDDASDRTATPRRQD